MSTLNTKQRDALRDSDFGDPEGRKFPILDQDDVDSAAHLIGKAGNPEAVKARIKGIAKRKGLSIPDAWQDSKEASEQPDSADLHIDGYLNQSGRATGQGTAFFKKMMANLRERMKQRGMVRADEFETMVRQARSHAGGRARADRLSAALSRLQAAEQPPDYGNYAPCPSCAAGNTSDCTCPGCLAEDACWCCMVMAQGKADDQQDPSLIGESRSRPDANDDGGDAGGMGRRPRGQTYADPGVDPRADPDGDGDDDRNPTGADTDHDQQAAIPGESGDFVPDISLMGGVGGANRGGATARTPGDASDQEAGAQTPPAATDVDDPAEGTPGHTGGYSPVEHRQQHTRAAGERAADPLLSATGTPFRLFIPVRFQAGEAPQWIHYLPAPGTYQHPVYGEVELSRDRIADMVAKFNAGVYQRGPDGGPQVPIDGEHDTKVSGAMGWIRQLRTAGDGSAEARVEWTDRGRQMLGERRYAFFSPEWYDSWSEPSTGQQLTNIAIGGALTTRPFFKTNAQGSALRPLVASERGRWYVADDDGTGKRKELRAMATDGDSGGDGDGLTHGAYDGTHTHEHTHDGGTHSHGHAHDGDGAHADHPHTDAQEASLHGGVANARSRMNEVLTRTGTTVQETQEQRRFAELERRAVEAESAARQANERVAAMETAAMRRSFAETARAWQGAPLDEFVSFMEVLPADRLEWFVKLQRAHAEQVKKSVLFSEAGRAGVPATDSPQVRLDSLVKTRMADKNIPYAKAAREVIAEHPDLFERSKQASEMRSHTTQRPDDDEE